jgi:hypothetical protein
VKILEKKFCQIFPCSPSKSFRNILYRKCDVLNWPFTRPCYQALSWQVARRKQTAHESIQLFNHHLNIHHLNIHLNIHFSTIFIQKAKYFLVQKLFNDSSIVAISETQIMIKHSILSYAYSISVSATFYDFNCNLSLMRKCRDSE